MAVNLFQAGGGGNWGNTASWSLGTVPTASDGHVATFDATSPDCTLGGNRVCNAIDFTGYTNTLTMGTSTLSASGNVTLDTGMIISGTGAMIISATSTITSNGKTWPNELRFLNNNTKTIVGDLTVGGVLTISSVTTLNTTVAETLTLNGGITINQVFTSNPLIYLNGGTWSAGTNGAWSCVGGLTINSAGTVTVSGSVRFSSGTLTYQAGTVDTTGSTLTIGNTCTLDTDGIIWNDVFVTQNMTITISSQLTVSGLLRISGISGLIFTGTHGWTVGTLLALHTQAGSITLEEALTYTITSSFECFSSRIGSTVLFTSSHASNKAILTLQNPAACNVLANFTRIDASNGRTIPTFNGTITNCLNIVEFHDLPTSSHAL
jgi:hypothetical protein